MESQKQEATVPVASVKCENCFQRPGTHRWGDALAQTHGLWAMWCEVCVLTKQIEHAEERATRLPNMRSRLAFLTADPSGSAPDSASDASPQSPA